MNKFSSPLQELVAYLDKISEDLMIQDTPPSLYDPINYLFNKKGKKIRGLLTLITHNLFDGNIEDVKSLVLAIESLHNFTLIHDDVMDNAVLRRGDLTINEKWSSNQAILSGDVLFIQACMHLLKSNQMRSSFLYDFMLISKQICEGQQLDLDMQTKKEVSLDDYFKMVNLKTGVLIQFSLVAAASMSQKGRSQLAQINSIGKDLGLLFQIQDDFLDLYGSKKNTGKSIGGDVFESKKSFLYITALDNASLTTKKELIKIYYSNSKTKLNKVLSLYSELHVKKSVDNTITSLKYDIFNTISALHADQIKKNIFIEFITTLLNRDS